MNELIEIKAKAHVPGGILVDCELNGDQEVLTQMLTSAMYTENVIFAPMVLLAAVTYCEHEKIDILELRNRYRNRTKFKFR